jgi:hypothetical protein
MRILLLGLILTISSLQISPTLSVDQKKPSKGEKQPAEPTLSTSRTGETTKIEGQDTPPSKGDEKSSPAKKDGGEKRVTYWQRVTSPDVLPNWILMVVGVAGMSVGLITLALIYGQRKDTQRALEYARQSADAAYKSAQASLRNAEAVINAERAWLTASLEWSGDKGRIVGDANRSMLSLQLVIKNEGKTRAWIIERRLGFFVTDSVPDEPDLDSTDGVDQLTAIPAGGKFVDDWTPIGYGDMDKRKYSVVYGSVRYLDIFNEIRSTVYGYRVHPRIQEIEPLTEFPKYNGNG